MRIYKGAASKEVFRFVVFIVWGFLGRARVDQYIRVGGRVGLRREREGGWVRNGVWGGFGSVG